ncbi:PREDICTED: 50S ribosomal protein L13, chloroplastic-like isoform X2 [Nelumbo nucifera]|uniref:50S ribosomal protein L13, chloroplastic-like isoform X2 n=2 Tax=Nelumbo nucifera TaxID=4432 RepID=A0A1U8AYR7_NELNU|nr:PREDICTED: 50S ribosomal protein L13, chloroplastic-like isoform X2 [Nelumbo nucifera]DAD37711.1 TPA_asm: hypothetical protein HUJ06_008352 [Nelumbo nucifera]
MAAVYTPSSAFLSTPPQKVYSFASPKTPFLGFPVAAAKPSIQARALTLSKPTPNQIHCQGGAVVPKEQKWMFDESNINGPDIWNKTWYPKAADHVNTEKTWYVVDATDKILGRLASTIAIHIRGKNLATYTPSVDMGAFVIVVNAEKVAVSGKKRTQKLYRRHSGKPGGMKVETFDQLQQRIPERIIEHAVRGMLPKGREQHNLDLKKHLINLNALES